MKKKKQCNQCILWQDTERSDEPASETQLFGVPGMINYELSMNKFHEILFFRFGREDLFC